MATFTGSYVAIGTHPDARMNYIIDNLLTPRLLQFRQVSIYDEPAVLQGDKLTWKTVYGGWNEAFPLLVRKNGAKIDSVQVTDIDYTMGTFQVGAYVKGDRIHVNYNIDYFGVGVLAGLILSAVDVINTAASGPTTDYNLDNAPGNWDGVIADIAFSMAMEKLILEYDLWYGRLIFAIGGGQLEDGGGDILSALETLKTNSEERAYKTLENEKFKSPNAVAIPTQFYYQAIRGFGGSGGAHNIRNYGKFRGANRNKYQ